MSLWAPHGREGNTLGFYQYLKDEDLNAIHTASMAILETAGVLFHHPQVREGLAAAGARVDGERVYLDRRLVSSLLESAPTRFLLRAREPEKSVTVGDGTCLGPGYGAPFVRSEAGGRRKALMEDYDNFVRLVASSPVLDVNGGVLVEPSDVPASVRHVAMMASAIRGSGKPLIGITKGQREARDAITMTRAALGAGESPCLIGLVNVNTPLVYDPNMLGALVEYAREGEALIIASLAMAGATAPCSVAGTLALQNAEVLAGICATQALRPGCPVVYGSVSSVADMRYGSLSMGAPEASAMAAATVQMARYYRLPSRTGGSVTDSMLPDAQAGAESAMAMMASVLSGVNFVLHACGILESFMTMSYEKFMLDEEFVSMLKFLAEPPAFDEESLAVGLTVQMGPGSHFLTTEHTLRHFRDMWRPGLFTRGNFDVWRMAGSKDVRDKAREAWQSRLSAYSPPPLDSQVEAFFQEMVQVSIDPRALQEEQE